MHKQQWILVSCGIILLITIFCFGKTIDPTKKTFTSAADSSASITTSQLILRYKSILNVQQLQKIMQLENSVVRGDVKEQQIHIYHQLAGYWKDTLHKDDLGAYYVGEAAKLENSEKNLTFAAHLLLDDMLATDNAPMQHWLAIQAKELFEKALTINPLDDSSKVGLGACYMFGNISDNPMQGILAVKEVADKNPDNMYAQIILGLGGIQSGQYDKAIERFLLVVQKQPDNLEAILNLAETYDRKGDKANAVKWYNRTLNFLNIPEAKNEIESRIKTLQQNIN